ncbi:hypothetical protein JK635_01780 [Neobacillus sp. YIM B02564]|uniref:Uncharacterized protein n=2 Tax=Neobacillus paridis TaxID=2803862 RepID=A0ABS1TJQ5_9BACI|nr:hypothetical protein [Neobacillus paridis]
MHVPYKSTHLLSITLDDIDSVPIFHYKGEEIKEKVRVSFDWKTTDDNCTYPTYILLEHVDKPIRLGFNTKTIQHNHPIEEG